MSDGPAMNELDHPTTDLADVLAQLAGRWQPIMTRAQLADMLGVSRKTVARYGWPCDKRGVYVLEDVIDHIRSRSRVA